MQDRYPKVDLQGCHFWDQHTLCGVVFDISVEVERVKAHRTKKEKRTMTKIVRFVTEGNEKADESAKAGAMLDKSFKAEVRAETMKKERGGVCNFALCGWLPLFSGGMERL